MFRRASFAKIIAPMVCVIAAGAWAVAGAGQWVAAEAGPHTQTRLVYAGQIEPGQAKDRAHIEEPALLAGVEILLEDGWKTYWRSPGDGIPPAFDWSSSSNVAAITVLWPAPRRFSDRAGTYAGYRHRVMFPVIVTPKQRAAPVDLKLRLDYAVCKHICIPVEAELAERLDPASAPRPDVRRSVLAAVQKTPRISKTGDCGGGLAVRSVNAELGAPQPQLLVDVAFPAGGRPPDVFVEAPDEYYLPLVQTLGQPSDGRIRYRVDLAQGGDPTILKGKLLIITLSFEAGSCEITWPVK